MTGVEGALTGRLPGQRWKELKIIEQSGTYRGKKGPFWFS